jgi:hypothetical protein
MVVVGKSYCNIRVNLASLNKRLTKSVSPSHTLPIFFSIAKSTMADSDEEYRPDSNDNKIVVAVESHAEEGKNPQS